MYLTIQKINCFKPSDKVQNFFDGKGHGLYIEVLPTGTKCWRIRHTINGKKAVKTKV